MEGERVGKWQNPWGNGRTRGGMAEPVGERQNPWGNGRTRGGTAEPVGERQNPWGNGRTRGGTAEPVGESTSHRRRPRRLRPQRGTSPEASGRTHLGGRGEGDRVPGAAAVADGGMRDGHRDGGERHRRAAAVDGRLLRLHADDAGRRVALCTDSLAEVRLSPFTAARAVIRNIVTRNKKSRGIFE